MGVQRYFFEVINCLQTIYAVTVPALSKDEAIRKNAPIQRQGLFDVSEILVVFDATHRIVNQPNYILNIIPMHHFDRCVHVS